MIEIMEWNEKGIGEIEAKKCNCTCLCSCSCSEPWLAAANAAGSAAFPASTNSAVARKSGEPQNP